MICDLYLYLCYWKFWSNCNCYSGKECNLLMPRFLHSTPITDSQSCFSYFYRPQRSWDKVMFLHVSVILFTGGVCLSACWDTPPWDQTRPPPGPDTPRTRPTQDQTSIGLDPPPHPAAVHAGRYGQQAGGTHPIGMHTCGF